MVGDTCDGCCSRVRERCEGGPESTGTFKELEDLHSGWRHREGPGQAGMKEVGFFLGQL